ncbi:MAG: DUF1573 domain-containing protein [Bacteroidetes bacterium]|nr:DUF1573 domain-containing protein [Bacteroidota bacterium]
MKRKNIFYGLLIALSAITLTSCGTSNKGEGDMDSSVVENNKTADNPDAPNEVAAITCENPEWNFGKINEGEVVIHSFHIKNTGNHALRITNCVASCGCTTTKCKKEPIAPGEETDIEIKFDSKGKKENVTKTITVTANTLPPETEFKIRGFVIPSED